MSQDQLYPAISFHIRRSDLEQRWDVEAITYEHLEQLANKMRAWLREQFWTLVREKDYLQLHLPRKARILTDTFAATIPWQRFEIRTDFEEVDGELVYHLGRLVLSRSDLVSLGLEVQGLSEDQLRLVIEEIGVNILYGKSSVQVRFEREFGDYEDECLRDLVGRQNQWISILKTDSGLCEAGFCRFSARTTLAYWQREEAIRGYLSHRIAEALACRVPGFQSSRLRAEIRQALRFDYRQDLLGDSPFGRKEIEVWTTIARLKRVVPNLDNGFVQFAAFLPVLDLDGHLKYLFENSLDHGADRAKKAAGGSPQETSVQSTTVKPKPKPKASGITDAVARLLESKPKQAMTSREVFETLSLRDMPKVTYENVSSALFSLIYNPARGFRRLGDRHTEVRYWFDPDARTVPQETRKRGAISKAVLDFVLNLGEPTRSAEVFEALKDRSDLDGISRAAVHSALAHHADSDAPIRRIKNEDGSVMFGPM